MLCVFYLNTCIDSTYIDHLRVHLQYTRTHTHNSKNRGESVSFVLADHGTGALIFEIIPHAESTFWLSCDYEARHVRSCLQSAQRRDLSVCETRGMPYRSRSYWLSPCVARNQGRCLTGLLHHLCSPPSCVVLNQGWCLTGLLHHLCSPPCCVVVHQRRCLTGVLPHLYASCVVRN